MFFPDLLPSSPSPHAFDLLIHDRDDFIIKIFSALSPIPLAFFRPMVAYPLIPLSPSPSVPRSIDFPFLILTLPSRSVRTIRHIFFFCNSQSRCPTGWTELQMDVAFFLTWSRALPLSSCSEGLQRSFSFFPHTTVAFFPRRPSNVFPPYQPPAVASERHLLHDLSCRPVPNSSCPHGRNFCGKFFLLGPRSILAPYVPSTTR